MHSPTHKTCPPKCSLRCLLPSDTDGVPTGPTDLRECGSVKGEVIRFGDSPYPFGVDPTWRGECGLFESYRGRQGSKARRGGLWKATASERSWN